MRLAGAVAARAYGGVLSQEENEQLQYAEMLIDVSLNCNSHCYQVIGRINEDIFKIAFPAMIYFTQTNHLDAVEWLYPGDSWILTLQFCARKTQVLICGMPLLKVLIHPKNMF